jgi:uncharacterized protein YdeI (YjbR/CyaY-like superfamily)
MGLKARRVDSAERVEVKSRAEWRVWLSQNWQRTGGIWLVVYKKHHLHCLPWSDIVQEALCFGWIDGTRRRLDEDRTMLYVSPRKCGSIWSGLNKRHLQELASKNLIHPAGQAKIDAAKTDGSWTLLDDVEALIVPDDLGRALDAVPGARAGFAGFNPGSIRGLLWWIKSARTDETRRKRIERTARQAALGKVANAQ